MVGNPDPPHREAALSTPGSPPPTRRLRPERQFLLVAVPFGLLLAIVFPPFSIADEPQHFLRAWSIASGRAVPLKRGDSAGDFVPASLNRLIADLAGDLPLNLSRKVEPRVLLAALDRPLEAEPREWTDFRNTALASPLPYVPAAATIAIGRLAGIPPLGLFYLTRLASLAAALALLWTALRIVPTRRHLWVALALMPMTLGQLAAVSADGMLIALAFLWTALVARACAEDASPLAGRDVAGLALVAAALCSTKLPYVLLLGLVALIPRARFATPGRARAWTVIGLAAGAATACSVWAWRRIDLPVRPGISIDTARQFRELYTDPLHFAIVLIKDSIGHSVRYGLQFLGIKLGWLDAQVPWIAVGATFLLLVWLAIADTSADAQPSPAQRVVLCATLGVAWTAIAASQYVTFTPYRQGWIDGLQGRYLLPLAPAAALLLQSRRFAGADPGRWSAWIAGAQAAILALALAGVVRRYYLG